MALPVLPRWGRVFAVPVLALAGFAPDIAKADVLVDNVNGITLDAEGKVQRFTGLLIGDDGRIEQVLARNDKRPGKVDYKLDGKGRVLIPGLIDSHIDLMKFGFSQIITETPDAQPRPEDRDMALAKAQLLLLERGITTVTDMGTTIEAWQTYRRAGDLGALRIRIVAYAENADAMILIGGPGPTTWLYDDRLRLNGVRLSLDGTLAARGAMLKAPYADGPAPNASAQNGAGRLSDTQLKNLMSRAAMDNFQVAVEANGDKADAQVLDAIDELAQTYKGERRWRVEGLEVVDAADLPRLASHGVIASMRPGQLSGYATAEARLGPARLAAAYPWKSLTGAGVKLAYGSGAPAGQPQPFAGMATAITRQGPDGQPFGGWQPQEQLTREQALAAYTTGAAYAAFADGRLGQIARGQRADFLFLDRDPLLAGIEELKNTRVLETWIGGKLAYKAKDQ